MEGYRVGDALLSACKADHLEIVKFLIRKGVRVISYCISLLSIASFE